MWHNRSSELDISIIAYIDSAKVIKKGFEVTTVVYTSAP